jgi:pimeloyl-ACP methyl ester carboxylesterase
MSAASGNPAVNLMNAVETNGGTLYLTDTNTAYSQTYGRYGGNRSKYPRITASTPLTLPANIFTNAANKCFLFEAAGIGSGQLVLTISQGSNVLAETSAWIDLHDVKDLYERDYVKVVTSTNPPSTWTSTNWVENSLPTQADEDRNIIVYVHGFDNTVPSWRVRSDIVFKRLYWTGYRGKFASVSWPCKALNILDPSTYNLSEFYAFKSAYAFKDYLNQLRGRFPDYGVHVLAHSQGNAVASEAASLGAPFDTYILMQAAMPASGYDANAATDPNLVARDAPPLITPEWQPMGFAACTPI